MAKNKTASEKQYVYIVQASNTVNVCKIGITDNLERRLKEYSSMTGKSKTVVYRYLFACEVKDMKTVENAVKEHFKAEKETNNREIYFYNPLKFEAYVTFIKSHNLFVEEIFIKTEPPKQITKVKIVKQITPSLKERGLSPKDVMEKAKKVENDEFYTRYEDVEKELSMYDKSIWKDKTVFCNCDDAINVKSKINSSAFAWYFYKKFKELGLKKLICTHFSGKIDLFNSGKHAYIAYIYIMSKSVSGEPQMEKKEYELKDYNGSFDHPISLKILKEEADIVCTNPPFSRAADYWKTIIKSGKKFLIISNIANVKNDTYIPYFKENQVWAGYNEVGLVSESQKTAHEGGRALVYEYSDKRQTEI